MAYVGIQAQIRRNNIRSILILMGFPLLILAAVWAIIYFSGTYSYEGQMDVRTANQAFLGTAPFVVIGVGIWFMIAFFAHSSIIRSATGAKTLERRNNMKVYNLVENLCIAEGMPMPKVNIIESPALNAYASGINEKTYTVTLTRGIIERLNDDELEGVIAHELMHIKNRDVRLLIVSIIFVGIISFAAQVLFRSMFYSSMGRGRKTDGRLMIVAVLIVFIAYLISLVFRFALSRKREYMADAGAAEMTKKPRALAGALRKISGNHRVAGIKSDDVAEMFIENTPDKSSGVMSFLTGLFSTHPPIDKRIKALEQY
ncbi:MAG: M48 family metallopeptidase [Rhodothermaceae bacterium]|nr:M48 family metallopeptidase [Rhodothermaceae bacterium]